MTSPYLKAAVSAAREAGRHIIKRLGNFGRVSYKRHNTINLVTEADTESERIIINRIKHTFPGHSFLAEESGLSGSGAGAGCKWIIDPIDGTTNYAHGLGIFCVSVAFEKNGSVIAGVVYDPSRDELFSAEKGRGARLNGKKIRVSKAADIGRALLVTGFAYNLREAKCANIETFRRFLLVSQGVRRTGSAAIDLCYVACGRFDGFWEVGLNPWDTAAGSLIAREAGAELTDFDGRPYSIYDKRILASNGKIHKRMLSILSRRCEPRHKL